MPADVISSTLLPAQGRELITIMDDYGTEFQLYVSVSDSANRQSYIDAALAQQSANQAALEAYAAQHGHDLSIQKAQGMAKKKAAMQPAGTIAIA